MTNRSGSNRAIYGLFWKGSLPLNRKIMSLLQDSILGNKMIKLDMNSLPNHQFSLIKPQGQYLEQQQIKCQIGPYNSLMLLRKTLNLAPKVELARIVTYSCLVAYTYFSCLVASTCLQGSKLMIEYGLCFLSFIVRQVLALDSLFRSNWNLQGNLTRYSQWWIN